MKRTIQEISLSFTKEAVSSPRMLEDLAAMEKYMAESYDGRTFVELIQNADDAGSLRVYVFSCGDTLIVANDGRPFNRSDIMSICRSGSSNKRRGNSIGYRGVGFKSATTISSEIIIYSADAYFTFSKSICAQKLNISPEKVPTVRIPYPYDPFCLPSEVLNRIEKAKQLGFTTFFVFLHAKIEKFLAELDGFNSGWMIFLTNINEIDIDISRNTYSCIVERKALNDNDRMLSIVGSDEQWYITGENSAAIAFRYNSTGIVPCEANDAVFHCYLPSIDRTGFPFKINADFSTDPSRKHLIFDELSKQAMDRISRVYADFVINVVTNNNTKLLSAVSLLSSRISLSELSSELENGIVRRLRNSPWVGLNNGTTVTPESALVLPSWLSGDEKEHLIAVAPSVSHSTPSNSMCKTIDKYEALLSRLGAKEFTNKNWIALLKSLEVVQLLDDSLIGKIFVYSCRGCLSDKDKLDDIIFPLKNGQYIRIADLSDDTILSQSFVNVVSVLNSQEKISLSATYPALSCLLKAKLSKGKSGKTIKLPGTSKGTTALVLSKWKTPEQNCIALETMNGNTAKDVSKKADGYRVVSIDSKGNEYYIAVKNIGALGDSFALNESEYAAALQYGDRFKVYLFTTATSNVKYQVIANPANTLKMTKVVKEWEWISDGVTNTSTDLDMLTSGKVTSTDFDNMSGEQFEIMCAQLLLKNGFEDISLTKTSGDQGIDIIAYRDGIKHGIQCKCYSSDLGNSAIQEAFAGKTFYKCHVGIVLTNRGFTPSAVQLAESNGVVLWDRNVLINMLKKTTE